MSRPGPVHAKDRLRAVLRAADNGRTQAAKTQGGKQRPVFDNAQVAKTYARWAPFYDPAFAQIMRWGRTAAVACANRHFGGRILDVGVGTGLELPMFHPSLTVVGIDLSEPMLRRAARRTRSGGLQQVAGLARMDACQLAFGDGYFDVVIAPFVMTVLPQPEASLDEWLRVLRDDGEIVLVNHIGADQGPMARFEEWLGQHGASLGWRPEFPWSILGNWLAKRPQCHLVERRSLPPFGLFTLVRIRKTPLVDAQSQAS